MDFEFNWRPVEGRPYSQARQCTTPFGLLVIGPGRGPRSKLFVRLDRETISRFEVNMSAAVMRAETEVRKRMERWNQNPTSGGKRLHT